MKGPSIDGSNVSAQAVKTLFLGHQGEGGRDVTRILLCRAFRVPGLPALGTASSSMGVEDLGQYDASRQLHQDLAVHRVKAFVLLDLHYRDIGSGSVPWLDHSTQIVTSIGSIHGSRAPAAMRSTLVRRPLLAVVREFDISALTTRAA